MTTLLMIMAAVAAEPPEPTPAPTIVVTAPSWRRPLPDGVLARMRGGVRLPNGLELALGIDIQTWIDGNLALHTVYASEGSQPGLRVYTDGPTPPKTAPATQTIETGGVPAVPLLVIDRSPTGTTVLPRSGAAPTTVNLVNGDPAIWLSGEGQELIPVVPGGPPVDAPPGQVSLGRDENGAVVTLTAPTLEVRHLVGQATGVIVANTANDRMIDTVSSINVDLKGLSPGLLQGAFMAQRAALESIVGR